jgi:3'-phosphoadenosine 5'-phosphosulfate (PAPS) 3'-phosphatase
MFTDWALEGRVASDLARLAGKAILEVYATRFEVRFKGPDDPVTDADLQAQDIIVEGLTREFPHDGIVSEECPIMEEARRKPRAFGTWIRWTLPANMWPIRGSVP